MATKLSALITTLILGSSSVALASHDDARRLESTSSLPTADRAPLARPPLYRDDDAALRAPRHRWFRDHRRDDRELRGDADLGPRRYRSHWVTLGTAALGAGRSIIDVDQRGTFTQLRIQADSGRTYLDRVVVRFRDGSRQVVDVERVLDRDDRWIQFELDGNNRRIDAVALVGDTRRGGALQVFGI